MESSYLLEKRIISMCFNPIKDTVFFLTADNDKIDLTEEDLTKNIMIRRFKLLRTTECNIVNQNYRRIPNGTYEGYSLYFWELTRKILVVYPFGYLLIYDYNTSALTAHFQCQGMKTYSIRNILGSPIQNSIFFSAEGMRNIYHLNYDNIKSNITYNKLVLPIGETVFDIVCHPSEKFIFAGSSDSLIRIFDYSKEFNEVKVGLVDVILGKDNKPLRNQNEIIKKNGILSVISLDINNLGTLLLSGNENGFIYLWDALSAIKNRRILLAKERFSSAGILSVKFIKTKQFETLNRFICLTKEGKFYILNIVSKDENGYKTSSFNKLYENSIFNQIIYPLTKYNLITSNFLNISYHTNMLCLKWPTLRIDRIKISQEKTEDYLLFTNFTSKFFFIYDNLFPKINYALATQMEFLNYEDYIPISNKNNLVFSRRVFVVDNFFIYYYDVMTGQTKKLFQYTKEFNLKSIYPLKFNVKEKENIVYFILLIENENFQKIVLLSTYNLTSNSIIHAHRFDDVIDFVVLGNSTNDFNELFMLNKNKQSGSIFNLKEKSKKDGLNLEGTVLRLYWTPFNNGYSILYRNILSELKYSFNSNPMNDFYDYRCGNITLRLDYSEREIDVVWKKTDNEKYICAISMIEKIVITDEDLRILYFYKIGLLENPNIISSLYWIGKTLFYTKGSSISYFYGEDNLNQKIFSSDQSNTIISGILSDRYILISKLHGSKDLNNIVVTTPMLNPLEPILMGYLDNYAIDYNLVKEAVINLFSNQISQNLIDKLIRKDLKEVAWTLLNDAKFSFPNTDKKVQILNDLLKFDFVLDNIIPNKNLHNDMDLDELLWQFNYDTSQDNIKEILIGECNILIQYGQFDLAVKILELISDYPKVLNLLLLTTNKDEFEKLRIMFQARNSLSYSDSVMINGLFMKNKENVLHNYNKVFDTYKGEPFIFGANQDKFTISSVKDAVNKINKKNSHINTMQKKILSFGETPFSQFTTFYNTESDKNELVNICSLMIQKIDNFYGYKNTVCMNNQQEKKVDFSDYSVPLSVMKEENTNIDDSLDQNIEEINEIQYLTAYYHCDKGSGLVVEDITENNLEALVSYNSNADTGEEKFDDIIWTPVLEEFEPLEYEDKWGRKSPGSHGIKFSKKLSTCMRIKHSNALYHIQKKFTIEFWIKIFNINITLLNKESFIIDIQNGEFIVNYKGVIKPAVKIQDYLINCDVWSHITITYRKKNSKLIIYLNCEEILNYVINLNEDLGLVGDICFGNSNLDAELTEIRIWKEEIPIKLIKENYKSPLPILAENKRKLRMKINKQDDQGTKKKFEFGKNDKTNRFQSFAVKNQEKKIEEHNVEMDKNLYEFNPIMENQDFEKMNHYPSLGSILDKRAVNQDFNFKFDDIQPVDNIPWNNNLDFNFDK